MLKTVDWEGITWTWQCEVAQTVETSCNGCENPEAGPLQVFVAVDPKGAKIEARWCKACVDIVECEQA